MHGDVLIFSSVFFEREVVQFCFASVCFEREKVTLVALVSAVSRNRIF